MAAIGDMCYDVARDNNHRIDLMGVEPNPDQTVGHNSRIPDYAHFWPRYLLEHQHPQCRRLHYLGTSGAVLSVVAAIITGQWLLILAGVVFGYFCAWMAHLFIEKNTPMTFSYPVWSFLSDFRMTWRWMTFRINKDLETAKNL